MKYMSFTEVHLLNIFYKGIERQFQMALDIASNGNFMTKTIEEAIGLIDNLATSNNNNYQEPLYAWNHVRDGSKDQLEEVNYIASQENSKKKLQFNNFQHGFQAPKQVQRDMVVAPQEKKVELLL